MTLPSLMLALVTCSSPAGYVIDRVSVEAGVTRKLANHTWRVSYTPEKYYLTTFACDTPWSCERKALEVSKRLFDSFALGDRFPAWRLP